MSGAIAAIRTRSLRKHYAGSPAPALDGLDLTVAPGTVHGLLGPNGAGKTTAVRILTTLLRADSGRAEIDGIDVTAQPHRVRERIGLVGQYAALDEILDGRRNLVLFGRLFHLTAADGPPPGRRTARPLRARRRRRAGPSGATPAACVAGSTWPPSMILAPAVLFLDEPTTGLDPRGRAEVWDAVRALVADGTTVLLTTQYLDEADQLADRISLLGTGEGAAGGGAGGGRVVAEGTPDELRSRIGGDHIEVVVRHHADLPAAAAVVERVTGRPAECDPDLRRAAAPVDDRMRALGATLAALVDAGIDAEDLTVRRPSLDEVFLQLTGAGVAR